MRTSPGCNRIGAVLVDRRRVDTWASFDETSYFSDQMEQYNTAILAPVVHRKLRYLMEIPAWRGPDVPHPFEADLLEAQLIDCLSLVSSIHLQPVRKTHHSDLARELVRLSF